MMLQGRVSSVVSLATMHYLAGLSARLLFRPVLLSLPPVSPGEVLGLQE